MGRSLRSRRLAGDGPSCYDCGCSDRDQYRDRRRGVSMMVQGPFDLDPRAGWSRLSGACRLAVVVPIVGLLATTLWAGQVDKDKRPGKLILFDGRTLSGWKKTDFYKAGAVKVEDGKIVIGAGSSMTGITTTRPDLPKLDYELIYDAMRESGEDFFAAATFPVGPSYITLVNGGWGGNVTGLSSLNGADASENQTGGFFKYQNNTWYKFRVRVTDLMIRCWIDDKEVVAVDHKDRRVGTRIETRPNQPLGFATWQTSGALRKVEMRKLTTDEIEAVNKARE